MPKVWRLKQEIPLDISENLGEYPKFFQQLLYNRGLIKKDEISEFLNPKYENLHSPFLFKDMQKAVDRIWQAIEKNEQITRPLLIRNILDIYYQHSLCFLQVLWIFC